MRTVAQHRRFDEASLLGWLRSQVYMAYEVGLPAAAYAEFRASAEARLAELRRPDGTYDQTGSDSTSWPGARTEPGLRATPSG